MVRNDEPNGVFSLLDTDVYKLTMQCAILKHFPTVPVEYTFTNRTATMRLSRKAAMWLHDSINALENITLTHAEMEWLQQNCRFLHTTYLEYLRSFRFRPREHVTLLMKPTENDDLVDLDLRISGLWLETVPYEIPLLALTSQAYFMFMDTDWDYQNQTALAHDKGMRLIDASCVVSEFGTRRRRDFRTQDLVVKGLVQAAKESVDRPGRLAGTSNVYFAMKYGLQALGTVAHEWYMGIAALHNDYERANELGLWHWLDTYGEGTLGIALTDTFGTPNFFRAFRKPVSNPHGPDNGRWSGRTYADVFTGVRQDSGDPEDYLRRAAAFYKSVGITGKSIIFSDSLNVEKCVKYDMVTQATGLQPSFGVGTFFTNDFRSKSDRSRKSEPMNIVIKISKAASRHCVKLSDNLGKNTGDADTIEGVKRVLGYTEQLTNGA